MGTRNADLGQYYRDTCGVSAGVTYKIHRLEWLDIQIEVTWIDLSL